MAAALKTLSCWLAVLIAGGIAQAQVAPKAVITGPKDARCGSLVVLDASESTGTGRLWLLAVSPEETSFLPVESGRQCIFASPVAGSYRFVLVVCGTNERARSAIERMTMSANVDARVYGFVDTIRVMMAASDLLVSKAGGLTSAEAMASRLPMIMVNPIPGQETRNADLLVEQQAGWKALNLSHFQYKLSQVLVEPGLLERAALATQRLAKPAAARKILADVLATLHHSMRDPHATPH